MYNIIRSKDFDKSYIKIERSGKLGLQARNKLKETINFLACGKKLSIEYKDHQLNGEFKQYRECHIKGDLLLVYQIQKEELVLVLVNFGTHSYLGL